VTRHKQTLPARPAHRAGRAGLAVKTCALVLLCTLLAAPAMAGEAGGRTTQECVILLHGLGRTRLSMGYLQHRLGQAGYYVHNQGYPSREHAIKWLADNAVGRGLATCAARGAHRIHFVTHSLGGILVRQYLQDHRIDGLGRIVMLSPPNQGSEIAELLKDNILYRLATGPAGQQLGTGADSVPLHLEPVPGEIGIIIGNHSSDPWFSPSIPGADDGKVSVERAQLAGMQDFLVVDDGHTFIMQDDRVIWQILNFLRSGRFIHKTTELPP